MKGEGWRVRAKGGGWRVEGEGEGKLNFVLIACIAGTER